MLMEKIIEHENTTFYDCQELKALSSHYYHLYFQYVIKLPSKETFAHEVHLRKVVEFLSESSQYTQPTLDPEVTVTNIPVLKRLHGDIFKYVTETTKR